MERSVCVERSVGRGVGVWRGLCGNVCVECETYECVRGVHYVCARMRVLCVCVFNVRA